MMEWAIMSVSVSVPLTAGIVWATVKVRGNGNGNGNGKYVSLAEYNTFKEAVYRQLDRIEQGVADIVSRL